MTRDLDHLNDLPKRAANHVTEEKAEAAFQERLVESGRFILQRCDRKDYGTDCEIEIAEGGQATNIRIHVQLKGTESAMNADGSLSIEVSRANLNYLLMHSHSFYAAYHVPTSTLRICLAETVLRQYEHAGKNWTQQQSVTIKLTEDLTIERLDRLANLAGSASRMARNRRIEQTQATPENIPLIVQRTSAPVHVPDDPGLARQLLEQLYAKEADLEVSTAFDQFVAVLGKETEAIGLAYMSEINLGMSGKSQAPQRIADALGYFRNQLGAGRFERGSVHYSIGNALSALGQEEEAKGAFQAALAEPAFANSPEFASQGHKNLGSSFERLGDEKKAVEHYREALRLNPHLPESHNALAQYYIRQGEWERALEHLDQVAFTDPTRSKTATIAGWRVNVLFNLGDCKAAFREINSLLAEANRETWIWPYCARLVASFGRTTTECARQALAFWSRYVDALPETADGYRELILASLYLRTEGEDLGRTYGEFRDEFERQIERIENADEAAFLWDRLGHWAQDDANWQEAERCFRRAYELAGGHYGYCLGTAKNFLGQYAASLPILLQQAEHIQPDSKSWFQVGVAYGGLGQSDYAVEAYEKALEIEPDYDLAMFNLGGEYWNRGDKVEALDVWQTATERFPEHELTAKLKREMPQFF
ncbi:MAG: tetratricopeptide repeat protein [Pseudomonadota bacterium]